MQWPFPADDPYPALAALRRRGPVHWCPDLQSYLVVGHAEATTVLRDPRWSSNPSWLAGAVDGAPSGLEPLRETTLLFMDPPRHTELRRAVAPLFSPRRVAALTTRVRQITAAALEPLLDGEPVEVMADVAYPLSIGVIVELFDIGVEGATVLRHEVPALATMLEVRQPDPDALGAAAAAATELLVHLLPLVVRRRRAPGDDLLSALVAAPPAGAGLDPEDAVWTTILLLAAGHETTAGLIGNGLLALLDHPSQCALLWQCPEPHRVNAAVEELLRFDGPVQLVGRVGTAPRPLGEHRISPGDQVLVSLGAANRDPARFGHPDRLDLRRAGPPHLAFGAGAHYCLGAALARLEAREVFGQLAREMAPTDDWRVTATRAPSHTFHRLSSLVLRWHT